jgi:hypothetical protein
MYVPDPTGREKEEQEKGNSKGGRSRITGKEEKGRRREMEVKGGRGKDKRREREGGESHGKH